MKLSCLSSATRPGDKAYNEDALLLNGAFCGIFDGATGLTNSAPVMSNYPSDAAWFVEESKQYLELHLQDTSQTIQQLCQKAMAVCRSRWKGAISVDAIPSAGFAAVRQNGTVLECFCLGDVSLSVRLLSGAFLYFPEQELSLLDETALQAAIAYRKELGKCSYTHSSTASKASTNEKSTWWIFSSGSSGPLAQRQDCKSSFFSDSLYLSLFRWLCPIDRFRHSQGSQRLAPKNRTRGCQIASLIAYTSPTDRPELCQSAAF